ncbi:Fasciclin-2-like protein, partial [Leptotrombidium deliense]
FPLPKVTIVAESGEKLKTSKIVAENSVTQIIQFKNINKNDAGIYFCYVINSFGNSSAKAKIVVEYAPILQTSETEISSVCEGVVELNCVVDAVPISVVSWKKEGQIIVNSEMYSVQNYSLGNYSLLFNASKESNFEGIYVCEAENTVGIKRAQFVVTKMNKLIAPKIVEINQETKTSLSVKIEIINTCVEFDAFIFEIREADNCKPRHEEFKSDVQFPVILRDLKENTAYSIKVAVKTEEGVQSDFSVEMRSKTSNTSKTASIVVFTFVFVLIVIFLIDLCFYFVCGCGMLFRLLSFCGCIRAPHSIKNENNNDTEVGEQKKDLNVLHTNFEAQ